MSTGKRARVVGEDALLKNSSVTARWKDEVCGTRSASGGHRGVVQVDVAGFATSQDAKVLSSPKPSRSTVSATGSKKIRRKARAALIRRIRHLRCLPPRFSHPRIESRRVQGYAAPTNQEVLLGQDDGHEYRPFLNTTGEADAVRWNRRPVVALLQAIDKACASRNEPSPSSAISRDLDNISSGKDLQRVWTCYLNLTRIQNTHPVVQELFPDSRIPSKLLSRLSHFIIHSRPITASHFPALLKVMQHLWDIGSVPPRARWNALIRFAADGQRRGGKNGVRKSLAILNDYTKGLRPGSSMQGRAASLPSILDPNSPNQPNISTYNIIIHIAAKAMDGHLFRDAIDLLDRSGLAPTRITYLAQLNYYAEKKQLGHVRDVVRRLNEDGVDLGVDGINACLWAYTLSNQHSVALDIYRVLRDNRHADEDPETIARLRNKLETYEHIRIPSDARPDKRTYVMLIQTMSYNGNFTEAISIFADFLECTPRGRIHPSTAPAFRAIFHGFSKHAVGRLEELTDFNNPHNKWNLASLQRIYRLFLKLPPREVPSRSTIYWIMVAFDKASDHDVDLLQERWSELENRFAPTSPWLFAQPRLQRMKGMLFPPPGGLG